MHLLCDYLNQLGYEAYMYYIPSNNPDPLYPLPNVKVASSIQDSPHNLLILPEIYSIKQICHSLPKITLAIWWLSYTNAALFNTLQENTSSTFSCIHFFHSYFEYVNVTPLLPTQCMWFYLSDWVDFEEPTTTQERLPAVAYNYAKDRTTPYYCNLLKIPTVPIKDMTPTQVRETLSTVMIYADLGFHPGKDKLPREAAMCNCVVVTNKAGAAAYEEVIPISEKVTHDDDLILLLPQILANYPLFLEKQNRYRIRTKSEKEIFQKQVSQTWKQLQEILS